jgi:hypothetical protein
MYFILTLFFLSLFGIILMISRKLLVIQNTQVLNKEKIPLKIQFLEEWKYLTVKNIKKHGYAGLVATIRFYVLSVNFLKNKYEEVKIKVKNIRGKKLNTEEKREVSSFLKMISEYKQKIREIKKKVKEEENL